MGLWHMAGSKVLRGDQQIAEVYHDERDGLSWRGMYMHRVGFTNNGEILEDVKYETITEYLRLRR